MTQQPYYLLMHQVSKICTSNSLSNVPGLFSENVAYQINQQYTYYDN